MPNKTFRFTDSDVELLERLMERNGTNQMETIRAAMQCLDNANADAMHDDGIDNHHDGVVIDALVSQLAAKDEQISSLLDALNTAQETAKAAQALHASTAMAALESAEQKSERRGFLARLLGR